MWELVSEVQKPHRWRSVRSLGTDLGSKIEGPSSRTVTSAYIGDSQILGCLEIDRRLQEPSEMVFPKEVLKGQTGQKGKLATALNQRTLS